MDDDNVLDGDYLAEALAALSRHSEVGALGGRIVPEYETPPPGWTSEFVGLLACRDLGSETAISSGLWNPTSGRNEYPSLAPVGAGLVLRREAAFRWLATEDSGITDRRGESLSSSGDSDIVFGVMESGWRVAYVPSLRLTHLIPRNRLEGAYLARLNYGIQRSWIQVLRRHDACPWVPISPWSAIARKAKAWFTYRAWASEAARVRWRGACGHFDGRMA